MSNPNRKDTHYLINSTANYSERLLDRMMFENRGISVINTPVGGPINYIKKYWEHAREGFRMTFRMDREGRYNINPELLLAATTEPNLQVFLNAFNEMPKLETSQDNPSPLVFGHTVVTIGYLSTLKEVSIASLDPSLQGRQLGHLRGMRTDWQKNIDPESIWFMMDQLSKDSATALFKRGNFGRNTVMPLLRAAHFFAAGVHMTQDLKAA